MNVARRAARALARTLGASRRPVTPVRWGTLDRLDPVSAVFGLDRGTPIDRYYIAGFLLQHAAEIRGRVLEVGTREYTERFGASRVTQSDVLHATPDNADATIVADLSAPGSLATAAYDCIVLTQTLQFIFDMPGAIRTSYQALRPGGVVLATFTGISQVSRYDMERWGDWWRVTSLSARRLFAEVFPADCVRVTAHGNVKAAVAFLHGLSAEELRTEELDYVDPSYELVITVRAVRPA